MDQSNFLSPSVRNTLFVAIILVYLVLALTNVFTLMPWTDEGLLGGPAYNLLHGRGMGTPLLDPTSTWGVRNLTGINQYTYWVQPLYTVSTFVWLSAMPFGLFFIRLHSVFWGLVVLLAWWALVRKLASVNGPTEDSQVHEFVALLAMGLIAVDSIFLWGAATARMDIMCAALGVSSLATYVLLRERHFTLAILLSQTCIALSGLTHPLAIAYCFALAALSVYLDRRLIRLGQIGLAAVPYLLAAAAWSIYIAKNPAVWWAQFSGNLGGRVGISFLLWVRNQGNAFLASYGMGPDSHGLAHLQLIILGLYVAAVAVSLSTRRIRDKQGYRALLIITFTIWITISLVDPEPLRFYRSHYSPPFAVLFAIWIATAWTARALPRTPLFSMVAVLAAIQIATTTYHARKDFYHTSYLVSTNYLKQHLQPGNIVFGSSELGFELGFEGNTIIDDYRLGYRTGRRADFIVIDTERYKQWIQNLKYLEPAAYNYATAMIDRDFRLAVQTSESRVYARTHD